MSRSFGDILARRAEKEREKKAAGQAASTPAPDAGPANPAGLAPDAGQAELASPAPVAGLAEPAGPAQSEAVDRKRAGQERRAAPAQPAGPVEATTPARDAGPAPFAGPRLADHTTGVDGYFALSNTVTDVLWETLGAYEAKLYIRLLRLSWGFQRDTTPRVGLPTLAAKSNMSVRKAQDAVKSLRAMGLVEVVSMNQGGDAGTIYRVMVPGTTPESLVRGAGLARRAGQADTADQARRAAIKESEKTHEKPVAGAPAVDVFSIRTIAARLFEAHRGEPGFDHERLRALVEAALLGQGATAEKSLIEEAIRGMAE